jgi:hypothetical protein
MRIYITNIPPSSIKSNIGKIESFLINKNGFKKYEIFSEEFGTHIIENKYSNKNWHQTIYRIEPITKMDLHLTKKYNGYDLLFDKTEYITIPIVSQFPINYTLTKLTCFEYSFNKGSNTKYKNETELKLVIECIIETNSLMEKDIIPINFYFDSSNSINIYNNDLLEQINMFLLELI